MWYTIYATDTKNSLEKRLKARPEHLKRLNDLLNEGRLFVAGPFPSIDNEDPGPNGYSGSLIIAEFNSIEEAQEWAKNDPYNTQGVFKNVVVKPFKKTLP